MPKLRGYRFGREHQGPRRFAVRTAVLFLVFWGAVGLLPVSSFAQSESTRVLTIAQRLCSNPSESGGSTEASPVSSSKTESGRRGVGVGIRFSSLGIGGEVAVALTRHSNLRGGFNAFSFNHTFSKDGISYAGDLTLQSAEAHYDWYPIGRGIHLSPGIMAYNGNKLTANASVSGGNVFTLNGEQYISDPSNPVTGNGKVVVNSVAPTLMFGIGNLVRRSGRRFSVNFEVGVAYYGTPQTTLNLGGGVCSTLGIGCETIASDPTAVGDVLAEQRKINHDISPFKVYPLISLNFGYRIR